jgi:uncharacterized protein (TIGR00106 family)
VAIVAVSISPTGVGAAAGPIAESGDGAGVSRWVAEAIRVVREQNVVAYRLDPMFTTLEGDVDEIFALIRRMQEAVFTAGAVRVGTVIKMDDRRDRTASMDDKLRSIEEKL